MRVSVGILAWNEENSIGLCIQSLFTQSLLRETSALDAIEIVVIPNGCTDATESGARQQLEESTRAAPHVQGRVVALPTPGKSNAWNRYVHELSDPSADYLILMDADVELTHPDALSRLVEGLSADQEAAAASGLAVKDIEAATTRGWIARLSLAATALSRVGTVGLCGMLYCGRAQALRKVCMPIGLLVEDGFLRAMLATDSFSHGDEPQRIVRVDAASIRYRAETTLRGIIDHELRICTGSLLNFLLFEEFEHIVATAKLDEHIRRQNEFDAHWLRKFVVTRSRGRAWLVPTGWLVRRVSRARSAGQLTGRLTFLTFATFFDLGIALVSNHRIKHGKLNW